MCERFDQYRPILARVDFGWKLFNFGDECMRSARLVSSQHVSTAEEMMVVERTRNSERERETSSSLLWETPGDTELALGPDYRAI